MTSASNATANTASLRIGGRYTIAQSAKINATSPATGRMCSRRMSMAWARSHAGVPWTAIMSGLLRTPQCWNAYRWPIRMANAEMARLDTAMNTREGCLVFGLSLVSFISSSERQSHHFVNSRANWQICVDSFVGTPQFVGLSIM